jgi:hypothetical protein
MKTPNSITRARNCRQARAWQEAGRTLQSIDGRLKPDKEWGMEVVDEFQKPLYVLHIKAEKP